jgi:hypothetical protein
VVERGIAIEFQSWRPIFEKCSHLQEKEGVLTEIWHISEYCTGHAIPNEKKLFINRP